MQQIPEIQRNMRHAWRNPSLPAQARYAVALSMGPGPPYEKLIAYKA